MVNKEPKIHCTLIKTKFLLSKLVAWGCNTKLQTEFQ